MTKIYKFHLKTNKGVRIEYPIKDTMSVDEWKRMSNHINSIIQNLD